MATVFGISWAIGRQASALMQDQSLGAVATDPGVTAATAPPDQNLISVLKLKTAWRDGTTHLVMSPLEFMQRLASLVPGPRLHLIRWVSA